MNTCKFFFSTINQSLKAGNVYWAQLNRHGEDNLATLIKIVEDLILNFRPALFL